MKKIFIIKIILSLSFIYSQTPSNSAGTASNIFLRTGLTARTAALGESFTAVADDHNALYYNPAGLVNINMGSVGLNHTQWFEDIRFDNLIFGYNFDRKFGVALGVSHMWMPSIKGKDKFGNETSDFDVSSSIINLGFGYKIHPSIYLGLGIKYFQDNLADFSANGVAVDAGFYMHTAITGLTFGASVQNLGAEIRYDSRKEKIPFLYRAGLAYKIPRTDLRISIDGIKSIDTDIQLATGIEYTFQNTFSLRIGNQFKNQQTFSPGYGAGININEKYLLDYTFYSFEDLGNTHRIGFTFRFELPGQKIWSSNQSNNYIITKSRPPSNIEYSIEKDAIKITWLPIYKASYNVYAKLSKESSWKKINSGLIKGTNYSFKKPSGVENLLISVTALINGIESEFSREVEINVE